MKRCPSCGSKKRLRWPLLNPTVCSMRCAANSYLSLLSSGISHHCEVCGVYDCGEDHEVQS